MKCAFKLSLWIELLVILTITVGQGTMSKAGEHGLNTYKDNGRAVTSYRFADFMDVIDDFTGRTVKGAHPNGLEKCYIDKDGDGYGDINKEIISKNPPDNCVATYSDCNDNNAKVHPKRAEICGDEIDQNCDGSDDVCSEDVDLDGDGMSESEGDCNDRDPTIYRGAYDKCGDGIDQCCSGQDAVCSEDFETDSKTVARNAKKIVPDSEKVRSDSEKASLKSKKTISVFKRGKKDSKKAALKYIKVPSDSGENTVRAKKTFFDPEKAFLSFEETLLDFEKTLLGSKKSWLGIKETDPDPEKKAASDSEEDDSDSEEIFSDLEKAILDFLETDLNSKEVARSSREIALDSEEKSSDYDETDPNSKEVDLNPGDSYNDSTTLNQGDSNDNDPLVYPVTFDQNTNNIGRDSYKEDTIYPKETEYVSESQRERDYNDVNQDRGGSDGTNGESGYPKSNNVMENQGDDRSDGTNSEDTDGDTAEKQKESNGSNVLPAPPIIIPNSDQSPEKDDQKNDGNDQDPEKNTPNSDKNNQDSSGDDQGSEGNDNDGDGFTENDGDCNDDNREIHPGVDEICGDGIDQDCDGSDLECQPDPNDEDNDGDGYTENQNDCNDGDASIHPNADEVCGDRIDQDCDGSDLECPIDPNDVDDDGDGITENEGDCNDNDDEINPEAEEICGDNIDQNCNGENNEGCEEPSPFEILPPELDLPEESTEMDNGCENGDDSIKWEFSWFQVQGADQYQIEILNGREELVISQTTEAHEFSYECKDNSNEISGCDIYPSDYQSWHWRVRAGNADHGDIMWSDWSETRPFNIEPLNTDCEESRGEDYNIAITGLYPESEATLLTGDDVSVNFTYHVPGQENVRIFSHPFTNGNPTPNQKASPSPVYEAGEGQGENFFTISGGDTILVDHIQFTIESLEGQILWQGFFEVDYEFVDGSEDVDDDTTASENEDDTTLNSE